MFNYDVYTEEQAMAERFQLLQPGIYDAVVIASEDKRSSSGNPMMDMTLCAYDKEGKEHTIRDFLVFTKFMMWKIVHFADSANLLQEYTLQKLCSDTAINQRVKVKIGIEEGKEIPIDKLNGKPVGTKYFDKNKVEDYIKRSDNAEEFIGNEPLNDDVPF